MINTTDESIQPETTYPSLVRRFQSSFIDAILCFVMIACLMFIANSINENSSLLKIAALVIGFSYEPVMTYFSRTLGQRLMGLKVEAVAKGSFNLPGSYLRYIIKGLLGWISFLTIHSNPQRRAIHDFAGGTVMTVGS